jgi:hypothetical protein
MVGARPVEAPVAQHDAGHVQYRALQFRDGESRITGKLPRDALREEAGRPGRSRRRQQVTGAFAPDARVRLGEGLDRREVVGKVGQQVQHGVGL